MVRLGAEALASVLNDRHSISWFQKLLWQLLRRLDATGEDYSYQVFLVAQRAATDVREGFARGGCGGALLASRIKRAPWFEAVMNSPLNKVGVRPK
jgi:hypothetical protein